MLCGRIWIHDERARKRRRREWEEEMKGAGERGRGERRKEGVDHHERRADPPLLALH